MGAGPASFCASCPSAASGGAEELSVEAFSILIRGATGLRDSDESTLGGKSDPYCLCKVGPAGSSWEEKDRKTLRRSNAIQGEHDPVWNFAVAYDKDLLAGAELQIKVRDQDYLSSDDDLGSVRVPIAMLESHVGELRDYPLTGDKATGSVTLMTGPRVEDALMEQLKEGPKGQVDEKKWWWSRADAIGQYASRTANMVGYYFEMLGFLVAGQLPGATGLRNWFLRRSSDAKGEDTYRWEGPFPENCITYSGYAEVAERLRNLGERLGTNDNNGSSYRGNFLGFQLLNGALWPEKTNHVIGLGETQQNHAFCRALIAKLVGPPPEGRWTPDLLRQMAADFWKGKASVSSGDFKLWTTQVLHKIHLGVDLTWEEADDFTAFQSKALLMIPFPEKDMQKGARLWDLLGVDEALATKAKWLERYKTELKTILPEEAKTWSSEQLTLAASFVMDSLLFAGGASVPTVLAYCLSVPWTKWGKDNLPSDFQLRKSTIWPYIMETVRRFPPVAGVPYRDRSFGGSKPDQEVFLNVMMTAFDPRVWNDPDKFLLRAPEDYDRHSLMWADVAMAPVNKSPNSHACPAKDLSIRMSVEFLTAFLQASLGGEDQVQKDAPLDISKWDISPEVVIINEYGPLPPYTLTRKGS